VTSPRDGSEAESSLADYVSLGNFDPLVARRIVQRFIEHKIRYDRYDLVGERLSDVRL
jgi:hypothetical protein